MITIPLKLVNTSFEKYAVPNNPNQNIEETKIKTIFGTKIIRRVKEELIDIKGNITKGSNSLFVAPIKIGGQDFNVVLDTGSVNLWVPKVGSKDQANLTNHYDPQKSSSAIPTTETFEITYGTGSTKGNYYSDYATFITNAAYNLLFGAATETNFDVPGADGIMGLARDYKTYMYSPLWTLNAKGYIDSKSFSFKYLGDDKVEMYMGGEHPDFNNTENTASCQLLSQSVYDNLLWTCKLYSLGFLNADFSKNVTVSCGYNFLFDTGSNIMRLPKDTLTGKDVFDPMTNSDFKKLRIQFMEVQISLIGQPFFRYFHTKFDHENKILKFYTENKESMIYSYAKPNDDKAKHFDPDNIVNSWLNENTIKIIAIVSVCVGAILIIVIIIKCGKKSCCKKNKN